MAKPVAPIWRMTIEPGRPDPGPMAAIQTRKPSPSSRAIAQRSPLPSAEQSSMAVIALPEQRPAQIAGRQLAVGDSTARIRRWRRPCLSASWLNQKFDREELVAERAEIARGGPRFRHAIRPGRQLPQSRPCLRRRRARGFLARGNARLGRSPVRPGGKDSADVRDSSAALSTARTYFALLREGSSDRRRQCSRRAVLQRRGRANQALLAGNVRGYDESAALFRLAVARSAKLSFRSEIAR